MKGVTNKLGMVDEEFKQGLINYRLKHFTKAIEHFNAVLNLNQRHLQAQDYRSKSQEAINKGEDIPIEEEQTVEIVEPETISETADAQPGEEESSDAGLAIWIIIILFVVVPLVFIILIVVIIIIVVRKKRAPAVTTAAATPAAAPKAEPQKAKAEEKKTAAKGKFCPSCGSPVKDGVKFCSSCGNKIE